MGHGLLYILHNKYAIPTLISSLPYGVGEPPFGGFQESEITINNHWEIRAKECVNLQNARNLYEKWKEKNGKPDNEMRRLIYQKSKLENINEQSLSTILLNWKKKFKIRILKKI